MGKCNVKDGKENRGGQSDFWNEHRIMVLNIMLFEFVKLTLSFIKP